MFQIPEIILCIKYACKRNDLEDSDFPKYLIHKTTSLKYILSSLSLAVLSYAVSILKCMSQLQVRDVLGQSQHFDLLRIPDKMMYHLGGRLWVNFG